MKVDNVIVFPTEPGTLTGQFGPTMQGATAPVVVDLRQRDGTALDLTGFTLALYFWLTSTPGTVYEATGTFPVLADVATYMPSDDDVSVAGAFTMIVHASDGVTTHKSVPLAWQIVADPAYGGGGSPNPAVFVTAEEKAWLTQLPQVQGFLMQRTSIDADETITIPAGHAMVVTQPFENNGVIEINGRLTILGDAAEASQQEFGHAAAMAVRNHDELRENVHGIADTRLLETLAGAQAKANAAQAAAIAALLIHEEDATNPHEVTAAQAGADPSGSANAAQVAAIAASAPRIAVVNSQYSTVYTFVLADDNKIVTSNSSSATTFTIPLATVVAFPTGAIIWIEQHGAGALTIAATAGVTLNSLLSKKTLAGQYATAMLKKTAYNTWLLSGALI